MKACRDPIRGNGRFPRNPIESAWKFVSISGPDECWPWIGGVHIKGYGVFYSDSKNLKAHRIIYQLSFGQIPDGKLIMHKCNNKLCCNPKHLQIGTDLENQAHAGITQVRRTNTSGRTGVQKKGNGWRARTTVNRKSIILYQGPSFEEACKARDLWDAYRLTEILT